MPREGVPYPERMLCSLKCELRNIWNALNGKLHSVNGVEGDGAGNVNIVSGDAAVTVTPDASLNQIEVSLDRSQLPSADVTSVNGETGAVVLDASEIDSGVLAPGNSVQDDIGSIYTQVQGINSGLTGEAAARANADSALQTNINAEALTRSSDDAALQSQINALPTFSDVSDALDNYATMARTVNNQNIGGIKTFTASPYISAGKNSKLELTTNTQQGETPATPSVCAVEFFRGTTYNGRFAETIEADGSGTIDIMIKGNTLSKEGRLQIYEDINNSRFVIRFWNGNSWQVIA